VHPERQSAVHVVVADLTAPMLEDEDARHLSAALRLRPGEVVSATDGRGGVVMCRYAGDGALEVDGPTHRVGRPTPAVTVGLTPVKGDRTEWAVQKLTEVGVDHIVVMHTERSVVVWPAERVAGRLEKLHRIARQALMQSRGCWVPAIDGVSGLAAFAGAPGAAMADPDGSSPTLDHPTVLIGPEGGWSEGEMVGGLPLVSLGSAVMRAETAAVAAGVLLVALRSGLVESPPVRGPIGRR
jgi:16S rRNA (uracil1498-N3)-methyltransferase